MKIPNVFIQSTIIISICFGFLPMDKASAQGEEDFLLLMVPSIVSANSNERPRSPTSPISDVERPGPDNTGPSGDLTKVNDGFTVKENGALIENIDLDGCISVSANNVTIRNVRINCESFYAIRMNSGYSGLLVEDVEMLGMQSAAILGSDFIARRVNVHDSGGDAFKPGRNVVIEDSWIHRLGTIDNSHSDAVQMVSGGGVIFRRNFVDMPDIEGFTNSQCLIIQTNNGPIDNVLIEDNWLNGGGYCIQINDKGNGHGSPQNIQILNNQFGPDCQFGTILVRGDDADTVISGNIFELTGKEIGVDEPFTSCGNDFE